MPTLTPIPGSATCTTYQPPGTEGPIWDVEVAPYGKVWVAAYRGVARLERSTGEWTTYSLMNGLPGDQVLSITAGPGLTAWLPLRDSQGVALFNGTSWIHYTAEDGLPSEDVLGVSVARDGSIWFATAEGAARWEPESDAWTYYTTRDGLFSDRVEKVLFTPDGRIWFAHLGALTYLQPANADDEPDTWGTYGDGQFLGTRKAVVSPDGRLWVGQAYYDPDGQEWADTVYRDIHIQGLAVDRQGGLWIARKDGALYLPDPLTGPRETWRGYSSAQGLAGDDVFVIAPESDQVVWFGTRDGLSRCVLE
jgi:ligand-binding sensor domain-containing protein